MIFRRALRPNLTPMIDVVFLLLLFFLLSTQTGRIEAVKLETAQASGEASAAAPMLVELGEVLQLNGQEIAKDALIEALRASDRLIAIRPEAGIDVQELLDFTSSLRNAGLERIVLVGGIK